MTSTELYLTSLGYALAAHTRLQAAKAKHDKMGNPEAHGEPGFDLDPVVLQAKRDIADALPRVEKAFDLFLTDRIAELSKPK
jgi:hypothetical protein